ncbi:hypothetical protein BpHYR1_007646 [Brachionus plicatilis]|uniref:Uncharacterized protein n=1 Tax=Brachionus plicatilis TaxID=10195 RepID=A0A3M7RXY5_BRAPC|nr:hypothetical protein BpHYR1_007646 [Brachionus plicatilis]
MKINTWTCILAKNIGSYRFKKSNSTEYLTILLNIILALMSLYKGSYYLNILHFLYFVPKRIFILKIDCVNKARLMK